MKVKYILLNIFLIGGFLIPFVSNAQVEGFEKNFYVEPVFSESGSSYTNKGIFVLSSDGLDFYIDSSYWTNLTENEKKETKSMLQEIGKKFKSNRTKVVSLFGAERTPGIDNNPNLVVFLYPMKSDYRGYVRPIDGYEKMIAPLSNESEMVYLNIDKIESPFFDEFLIHEFTHLVTFNQKDIVGDETIWLEEMLAEYAAVMVDNSEDNQYKYIDQRIKDFYKNPTSSLIGWDNSVNDYGLVVLFAQYVVDHYGEKVLADVMKSKKTGIEAFDDALSRNGVGKTFNEVFRDWSVALAVNDCKNESVYCYKTEDLKGVKVIPFNNFLPYTGEATISIGQNIENYSNQWQKFSGGSGELTIDFNGQDNAVINASYIAETNTGSFLTGDLKLNDKNEGQVFLPDMGAGYKSVIIIPRVVDQGQSSTSTKKYTYSIKANIVPEIEEIVEETPEENILKAVFNVDKPLNELTQKELLILLIKILLIQRGYEF